MLHYDKLTAEAVNEVVRYCMVPEEKFQTLLANVPEKRDEIVFVDGAYLLRGVDYHPYILDAAKLKERDEDILFLTTQLPDECKADRGFGNFLSCCMDKNGAQWGEHENVDELLALGRATNKAMFWPTRWDDGKTTSPYVMTVTGRPSVTPERPHDDFKTWPIIRYFLLAPLNLLVVIILTLTWPFRRFYHVLVAAKHRRAGKGKAVKGDYLGDDFCDVVGMGELWYSIPFGRAIHELI